MKKIAAIILSLIMLLSSMVLPSFAARSTYDIPAVLAANGEEHIYLGKEARINVTLDGIISDGEYTWSNKISSTNATQVVNVAGMAKSDIVEYMSYDSDYIYYAVVIKLAANNVVDFRIKPATTVAAGDIANELSHTNATLAWHQVQLVSDSISELRGKDPATNSYIQGTADPLSRMGAKAVGKYDSATQYATIEYKISRTYIDEASGLTTGSVDTYAFYLCHKTSDSLNAYGRNIANVLTAEQKAALNNTTSTSAPRYIVLGGYETDIVDALDDAGYSLYAMQTSSAPTIDGAITEGEYTAYSGQSIANSGKWDKWYADACGSSQSFGYYLSHDANYVYIAFRFDNGGRDRGNSLAIGTSLDANYKATNRLIFADGTQSGGRTPYYRDLNGTTYTNIDAYCEYAKTADYGHSTSSVSEWKISKMLLMQELGVASLDDLNVAFYLCAYENSSGNYITAPVSTLNCVGNTGSEMVGMPMHLINTTKPETQSIASARISASSGLRFKTSVDKSYIKMLQGVEGNTVEVGTLIAPTDMLSGRALTHAIGTDGVNYIDVKANVNKPFASNNGVNTYAGSITNIKNENLGREFTAVGYIKVTNGANVTYYYSDTSAARTISDVATAAIADVSSTYAPAGDYINKITSGTNTGKYSPYTEAQRTLLATLVA